jgi:hypothetical protein
MVKSATPVDTGASMLSDRHATNDYGEATARALSHLETPEKESETCEAQQTPVHLSSVGTHEP